ncbi:hypothetical protein B0H16DRAFT_1460562 [Mycena metata]|uniref:Uncharacterized protein n=1 Tax=Mycena metata TaxID=1033252 RepID=A0AAD7IVZ1_9AGAR|nr:hypothetical protein B0H16DRAFT_1460562 [Mycena metata]
MAKKEDVFAVHVSVPKSHGRPLWEEFRRSDDFNPNNRLFYYILPVFHLNGSVYGKHLLLLKEKLNLMTNLTLTEITDLHNKWVEEDYDYTALYFVRRLMEELNDGLGCFTCINK